MLQNCEQQYEIKLQLKLYTYKIKYGTSQRQYKYNPYQKYQI